jgi:hypothetical protein
MGQQHPCRHLLALAASFSDGERWRELRDCRALIDDATAQRRCEWAAPSTNASQASSTRITWYQRDR